ncbi:MarR family winged helix-turn-helix transcriptional regulator [Amantichitinum ursilacus]|uniref:Transcriptional repressor MprA n=1 Tax=Amantichitinum ursilacus TaxID=857265 RepID=A0A0N0XJE5_9NEIS|nr:MarR family transcriptional regulator [Amantichitinum ursilacus]KPC52107.1 Transcriptional repressor MprA [Amantichitinum ursilacus]
MNDHVHPTPDAFPTFADIENRIERVCARVPGSDRQPVLLKMLLQHIAGGLNSRMNEVLREYNLNRISFLALVMLVSSGGKPLNPSDLAEATGESRANVTRICDELVAKSLLRREPNPEDRRRIDLYLAPQGEELVQRTLPKIQNHAFSPFNDLTAEERDLLEAILKKLLGAFA